MQHDIEFITRPGGSRVEVSTPVFCFVFDSIEG